MSLVKMFDKLEEDGYLINSVSSCGWAFWPDRGGYLDEHLLRALADEIERRNKPFWDEYEEYCKNLPPTNEPDTTFSDSGDLSGSGHTSADSERL